MRGRGKEEVRTSKGRKEEERRKEKERPRKGR